MPYISVNKGQTIQLWVEYKKQQTKDILFDSSMNCQQKSEAAEGKAQCYMRQYVVNICTILVLFSTLCDVMSLLNEGYSENGTNVKVNKN